MKDNVSIIPIFMPFWACPQICVFCNQSLQTGNKENSKISSTKLLQLLEDAKSKAVKYQSLNRKVELAFYGGTFSALPEEEFFTSLEFLKMTKQSELVQYARCSTRPDACDEKRLRIMKESGIDTIELGIQSYANHALCFSNRGYTKEIAIEACKKVKNAGCKLGIQLMPNLPGQTAENFLEDIEITLNLKPDFIRLYPCLVVEGTKLSQMYKNGEHRPWGFEMTLNLLAHAQFKMWQANIPVIRIGVAPEEEFYNKVIAGVHHKNLGQLVQARALELLFKELIQKNNIENPSDYIYYIPLHTKGFLMLSNSTFYKEQDITSKNIRFHNDDSYVIFEKNEVKH